MICVWSLQDVYKRQLHCIAAHRKKKMFIEVEREMARYDIIAGKIADDATNATPVSYTHLDVYKRQIFRIMNGMILQRSLLRRFIIRNQIIETEVF